MAKQGPPPEVRAARLGRGATGFGAGAILSVAGALAAVGVLLALEWGARLWTPDYLASARGPHVFSEVYGWASRGGASLELAGRRVTFNERGYRGRSLDATRTSLTRVVVLGDSIGFGLGVADDETFSSRIDARANGIEVANLSVQGYGPDQELLVLERQGLRLRPDVVILAFCMANDLAESILRVSLYDGATPKPRYRLAGDDLVLEAEGLRRGAIARAGQALADHSHLFNRLAAGGGPERPSGGRHWRERYAEALRQEDAVVALNRALVRRMDRLCRQRGIAFLVAAFPDRLSFKRKPPLLERFFGELAADGVRVLDMTERFQQLNLRLKDVALDGAGHLSPPGHSIVADVLEGEIQARQQARLVELRR